MTLTTSSGERTLVTTYTYDKNNNQTSILDVEGNLTRFEYDANNNQTVIVDALERRTINRYDEKNQLIEIIYPDDTYRLLSETIIDPINGDLTIAYNYDAVGNRLSMNNTVTGLTTYIYNNNDWLLTEITNDVATTYTYDNNGNTLIKSNTQEQVVYDWDQENRLVVVAITNSGGVSNIEYQYDFNGIRVASVADGVETRYLVDANREYTQVLEEYDSNGNTQVNYVNGWSLISQTRNGEDSFYGYDGHSGVRFLTDVDGNVTDTSRSFMGRHDQRHHDPFGRMA